LLNKANIKKIRESSGKSGSFFFFTHDNNFVIKTITSSEIETMKNNLIKNYFEHMKENPNSLISRIYGIYEIIIK